MTERKITAAQKRVEQQKQLDEIERIEQLKVAELKKKRQIKKDLKRKKGERDNQKLFDWLNRTDRIVYPFIAALCTGIIVFYVYILGRGGSVVMNSDLAGQYYDFLLGYRRILLNGGSLSYSFDMGMGLGLVGSLAYYLMSPFNLLVLFFPAEHMISAISLIIVLKISTMALVFGFYARTVLRRKGIEVIIFSLSYALCGFVLSYFFHIMWLDALILLPVACIQIKKLMEDNKKTGLILSLFLLFLTNFYMGFIVFACLFLYFMAYAFCVFGKKETKIFIKKLLQFLGSMIIAIAMSAFLIVPAMAQLKDRMGTALGEKFFSDVFQSDVFTIFRQCFIKLYEEYSDGQPLLYTGVFTIVLVAFYFCNKKIGKRERALAACLLIVMVCIMICRPLTLLMYAGSQNHYFEYRYAFFVSFLLATMACRQFPHMKEVGKRKICILLAGMLGTLIGYYLFVTRLADKISLAYFDKLEIHFGFESPAELYLNIFFLLVCVVILALLHIRKISFRNFSIAMLFMFIVEISFVGSVIIHNRRTVGVSNDVVQIKAMQNSSIVMKKLVEALPETEFFRVEKNFDTTENSGFGLGYKGIGIFTSIQYQGLDDLAKQLGYKSARSTIYNTGNTDITNALFGIKYTLHFSSKVYDMDTLPNQSTLQNMMYLKEEENSLPLGFMVDQEVKNLAFDKEVTNPFKNQEEILSAMLGGEKVKCYKECEVGTPALVGLEEGREEGDKIVYDWSDDLEGTAVIEYKVPMQYGRGKYYFYTTQDVADAQEENNSEQEIQSIKYFDNGYGEKYKDYVYDKKEEYQNMPAIINLTGDPDNINWDDMKYTYMDKNGSSQSEKDTLALSLFIQGSDKTVLQKPLFYYFDSEAFGEICSRLEAHALKITEFRDGYIKGEVQVEDARLLYTSIPYEKGWKVLIDGKEGETVPVLEQAFLGVDLTKGKHEIELVYEVPQIKIGIAISFAGITCFVVIYFVENRRKRRNSHGQNER